MRLFKIKDQLGNDFWAEYKCPHCGHTTKEIQGYMDKFYFKNVIPNMECPNCGKKENATKEVSNEK